MNLWRRYPVRGSFRRGKTDVSFQHRRCSALTPRALFKQIEAEAAGLKSDTRAAYVVPQIDAASRRSQALVELIDEAPRSAVPAGAIDALDHVRDAAARVTTTVDQMNPVHLWRLELVYGKSTAVGATRHLSEAVDLLRKFMR